MQVRDNLSPYPSRCIDQSILLPAFPTSFHINVYILPPLHIHSAGFRACTSPVDGTLSDTPVDRAQDVQWNS